MPWIAAQHERIAQHCGVEPRPKVRLDDGDAVRLAGLQGLEVKRRQVRWSRTVTIDIHLANISSRSAFLVLDEIGNRPFLDAERTRLCREFPGETVEEVYAVDLLVAARR